MVDAAGGSCSHPAAVSAAAEELGSAGPAVPAAAAATAEQKMLLAEARVVKLQAETFLRGFDSAELAGADVMPTIPAADIEALFERTRGTVRGLQALNGQARSTSLCVELTKLRDKLRKVHGQCGNSAR